MSNRKNPEVFERFERRLDWEASICQLYMSRKFTTEHIAKTYGISSRSVQRIVKRSGVIRSQADANRVAAPLKHYHRVPAHLKAKALKRTILARTRFALISTHPFCALCGARPDDGWRLEVDHKDNDPMNNTPGNLQVLCSRCNVGKSHLRRWGLPNDEAS